MGVWLDQLRSFFAYQDGELVSNGERVKSVDFRGQLVAYNSNTGMLTVGPTNTSQRADVEVTTTAALPYYTYASNVITFDADGAIQVDGVDLTTNMRVLVKDETSTPQYNGVYIVTDPGSVSSPSIWTRSSDFDSSIEFQSGAVVKVLAGTVNAGKKFVLTVGAGFTLGTDDITFTLLTDSGIYDIREFGAVEGGSADCSGALQDALDAAAPGGEVFIPRGVWKIDVTSATITIPAAVTLTGMDRGNRIGHREFSSQTHTGTLIHVHGTANDLFTFAAGGNQVVQNLEIYYPNQQINATPNAYGWTFNVGTNVHFSTIRNISCINPYDFIKVASANGITIDNIVGHPIHRGIYLGRVADVARISNVHFIPTANAIDTGATLTAWIQANGTAYLVDGAEEFTFSSCFAYGYNRGLSFEDTDVDGFRGVYGSWTGGGLDICNACVRVVEPNGLTLRGLKMSNCGLVPNGASANGVLFTDTHVPANADERPAIYMNNIAFWNTSSRAVYLSGANTYGIVHLASGSVRGHTNQAFRAEGNSRIMLSQVAVDGGTRTATADSGVIVDTDGYDP